MELQPGLSHELTLPVEHKLTIQSRDSHLPAVYATPAMIWAMEEAAARAVKPALPPGSITVGTAIHVEHLAATPEGMQVTVRAELTAVTGRLLEFRVEARDERELIGRGTVNRAIVDLARFNARLQKKVQS
jgi:predicted thioesterase